jgi:hypothetical protein
MSSSPRRFPPSPHRCRPWYQPPAPTQKEQSGGQGRSPARRPAPAHPSSCTSSAHNRSRAAVRGEGQCVAAAPGHADPCPVPAPGWQDLLGQRLVAPGLLGQQLILHPGREQFAGRRNSAAAAGRPHPAAQICRCISTSPAPRRPRCSS